MSVLAYADDLVLVARNKSTLQKLLDSASTSASTVGLEFRPNKCASLSFVNERRQPQRLELNEFIVQTRPIPAMSHDEHYRYLGVPIGMIHRIDDIPSIVPQVIEDIHAITNSLLAPWQKLDAIRSFVEPCLTYALRAGNPSKQSLEPLRTVLISSHRTIYDLPKRSTQAYFFASKHVGGLAFQDPTKEDDVQAIVQAIRILSSSDPTVAVSAWNELRSVVSCATSSNPTPALLTEFLSGSTSNRCSNLNYAASSLWSRCCNACRRLKVSFHFSETDLISISADDSAKIHAKTASQFLHRLIQQRAANTLMSLRDQGKVAQSLATDLYANGSTWTHTGVNMRFKDWRFIHKARLNLLPTNSVKARWCNTSPTCRHCVETEALPHILCHCRPEMVSIRARHNKIVHRISHAIRFGQVTTDHAIASAKSRLRPDIIVEEDNQVLIIDVTCPFDNGPTALEEAAAAKINKYEVLKEHFTEQNRVCHILPFVIGALGSWYPPNEAVLQRLGMTRSYRSLFRKLCCSHVIQGSCDIFRLHFGWDQNASE
ncbi:uncharacterized protein T26G10.4-like [Dendronephthya gigantea]|uniref:uncharacterized protein T26G10.4-like n=1 Tax=Dendronephthya gigantea TaxID=151771 RepID=UPI00106CABCE|nr:uncharacterized protein T26G10.4-like [Dendronephthya gigantea]